MATIGIRITGQGLLVGLGLVLLRSASMADEPTASPAEAEPPPPKLWTSSAFLGLTLTRGNSDTFLGNLTLDSRRQAPRWELALGLTAGYGESTVEGETEKTAEYMRGFGQYDRRFHQRGYLGLRNDAEYDAIAGVDYRLRVSPLVGWYLIQRTNTHLRVEAGPSWVFENLEGRPSDQYTAFRAGERFEHKLNQNTRLWQTLEYIPQVDDWSTRFLLIAEAGVDAAITRSLSLSLVLQNNYNNDPPAGRKANDLRVLAGLRYKF
jgi:putative salt-induced outer membrane protein YdiY